MQVVLNNKEFKSFISYLEKVGKIQMDTTIKLFPKAKEEIESKTEYEFVKELIEEELEPYKNIIEIYRLGYDENILEINHKVFMSYMDSMCEIVDTISPYTERIIDAISNHKEEIKRIPRKIDAMLTLINKPMVKKVVGYISNLLGVSGLVDDITKILNDIMKDKEIQSNLEEIENKFLSVIEQEVEKEVEEEE